MKTTAAFILTSKCNLDCRCCISDQEKDLTLKFVKEKIDSLPNTINKIAFTGGEALLIKDLGRMLEYTKKKGYITHLSTNGLLLRNFNGIDLIDEIALPLESHQRKIHDYLRGKGHFDLVQKLLGKLNKEIIINTVATKANIADLKNLEKLIKKNKKIIKWRVFKFKAEGRMGSLNKNLKVKDEDFRRLNLKAELREEINDEKDFIKIYLK